jgi:RimJ/RimL family protein N-acetyltransferase
MNYKLRPCTINDYELLFKLKVECLKWYVEKIYGWDDIVQREMLKKEMNEKMSYMKIIQVDNIDIGVTTHFIDKDGNDVVGLIAILPDYQGNGIGTDILKKYIDNASKRIILQVFKDNPAKLLYEKLGFKKYGETNTHILMEINKEEL